MLAVQQGSPVATSPSGLQAVTRNAAHHVDFCEPPDQVAIGDELGVCLEAPEAGEAFPLEVVLQCYVRKSPDDDYGVYEGESLSRNTEVGDGQSRAEVVFAVPPGPCSYHGECVTIEWQLEAYVGNNREDDSPDAEHQVRLAPGPVESFNFGRAPIDRQSPEVRGPYEFRRDRELFGVMPSLLVLAAGVAAAFEYAAVGIPWWIAFPVLAVGVVVFSGARIRNFGLAAERFSDLDIAVEPEVVSPGQSCQLELRGMDAEMVRSVDARLKCIERDGHARSGESASVHEETTTLEYDGREAWSGEFMVPADAPYSFYFPRPSASPSNPSSLFYIGWRVVFRVEFADLPDWTAMRTLRVRPPSGGAAS